MTGGAEPGSELGGIAGALGALAGGEGAVDAGCGCGTVEAARAAAAAPARLFDESHTGALDRRLHGVRGQRGAVHGGACGRAGASGPARTARVPAAA